MPSVNAALVFLCVYGCQTQTPQTLHAQWTELQIMVYYGQIQIPPPPVCLFKTVMSRQTALNIENRSFAWIAPA